MFFRLLIFSFIFIHSLSIKAQGKKTLHIERTEIPPKIDGVLNDGIWQIANEANDFIQFRPEMGKIIPSHQNTMVKMTYDD